MRFPIATFLVIAALADGCKTSTSAPPQPSVVEAAPVDAPKPALDSAAVERLNNQLSEDVRRILEQAEDFELIALKPGFIFGKEKIKAETLAANKYWRFLVVAKTKVTDASVKTELLDAFYKGVADARPDASAACFSPRHAIRATSKGKTVELVICFDCYGFRGSAPNGWIGGAVTKAPRETFNRVYTAAGLNIQP